MSNPIVITPSTSVVLVNTADFSGNPIVHLPNIEIYGRVITIRDNDGGSFTKPIIVSTTSGALFQEELSSIALSSFIIKESYGFITITPREADVITGNTRYGVMNAFAFPEAYPVLNLITLDCSAGYFNTTSTNILNVAGNTSIGGNTIITGNTNIGGNTLIGGNVTVSGSINYTNPSSITSVIGSLSTNLISSGTIYTSSFFGNTVDIANNIKASTLNVTDTVRFDISNSASWLAGGFDSNSFIIGKPDIYAGAQIGTGSNFFGIRAFSKDPISQYSTSLVFNQGKIGVNLTNDDIRNSVNSNALYVKGGLRLSNDGSVAYLIQRVDTTSAGSNIYLNTFDGTGSNYTSYSASNINQGFYNSGTQYKWMSVDKVGTIIDNVQFYTSNAANPRMKIDTVGNVGLGVGASSITEKFDVRGNILAGDSISSDNFIQFRPTIGTWRTGANNDMFYIYDQSLARNRLSIMNSTGNVGIGTVTPAYSLDVSGAIRTSGSLLLNRHSTIMGFNGSTYEDCFWPRASDNNTYLNYGSTANLSIRNNSNATRLRISENTQAMSFGNGTGSTIFQSDSIQIGTGTSSNQFAYIDLIGDSTYSDYGLRLMRENTGSNTTSYLSHRGTGAFNIIAQEAAPIILQTNNLERLRIDASGRLGVGIANPTTDLDVNGSVNIRGYQNTSNAQKLWVAVGSGTNSIAYSSNGITWTGVGTTNLSSGGAAVAWNGSLWVAVGSGTNSIVTSSDGVNWTGRSNIFNNAGNGIAWNGSLWVAVGNGTSDTIATSSDGITWTGGGKTIFTVEGRSVAWNGSLWVAVGDGSSNTIATSVDGLTWTGCGKTVFTTKGYNVTWNGSLWVAVGSGTNSIATSRDGTTWYGQGGSTFSGHGQGIAWNGIYFVAVGYGSNTIAASVDGFTWNGLGSIIFSGEGLSIAWNGSYWVAGGGYGTNTFATSGDGVTWAAQGTGGGAITSSVAGVAYSADPNPDVKINTLNIYAQGVPNYNSPNPQILTTYDRTVFNSAVKIIKNTTALDVGGDPHPYGLESLSKFAVYNIPMNPSGSYGNNAIIRMDVLGSATNWNFLSGVTRGTQVFRVESEGILTVANPTDSGAIMLKPNGATGNVIRYGGSGVNANMLRLVGLADAERMRIDANGNLGIGTTNPIAKLMVTSDPPYAISGSSGNNWGEDGSKPQLFLSGATNTNKRLALGYNTVTDAGAIQALDFTTGYKPLLLNPLAGNVGVGLTNPAYTFHTYGTASFGASLINQVAMTSNEIKWIGNSSRHFSIFNSNGSFTIRDTTASDQLGNPGTTLLTFNENFQEMSYGNGTGVTRFQTDSIQIGTGTTSNQNAYIDLVGDTTYSDYGFRLIRSNGGPNTGTNLIHRGTGDFQLYTHDAAPIVFQTNSTERMRITAAGNIGIGTASPSATLDVLNGQIAWNPTYSSGGLYGVGFNWDIRQLQYTTSSRKYKSKIINIPANEYDLNLLMRFRPVYYNGLAGSSDENNQFLGLIAEELEDLGAKHLVVYDPRTKSPGSIDYARITVHLVKCIQEQQNIIDNLEEKLKSIQSVQEDKNKSLETQLSKLQGEFSKLQDQVSYLLSKL